MALLQSYNIFSSLTAYKNLRVNLATNIDKLRQKAVQDQQIQQLKSELKDLESNY